VAEFLHAEGALLSGKKSPCYFHHRRKSDLCYLTITSTRRFLARPSVVLLLATGLLSP
jgi:hypothetical protein